jgi:hypothetical protein
MNIDRLVANLIDEVGLPVILQSWGNQRVEHTLQNWVRDWACRIESRRQKGPDGLKVASARSIDVPISKEAKAEYAKL